MKQETIDFTACRHCVCSEARRVSREMTRFFDETMRGTGVRATQFSVLAMLIQTGPIAATRLAAFLGLERTTLTRNLRPLLRDGLVRIDDDPDKRVRRVAITPEGEEAARRAFPFWKKAQDAAQAKAAAGPRPG